ncbi:MAG: DUF885 domain-containing protein [Sphingobium sp.]
MGDERLAALAERFWRFECRETPLAAILAGQPTEDEVVFRESADDHARRDAGAAEMLDALAAIPAEGLDDQDRATRILLERELRAVRDLYAVQAHLRPWLLPAGPDFNTVFFANSAAIADSAGAALYLKRLSTIPSFMADIRANLAAGHAIGIRYPRAVLEGAAANTRGMIAGNAEDLPWYGPFKRSAASGQAGVRDAAGRAAALIRDEIVPAMAAYADDLTGALAVGARESLSCCDTPGGGAYYETFVRHFTTTDMTPEAVHALGLGEVARLETELELLAAEAGHAGDLAGYRAFLTGDPQFVAESPDALRAALESLCKRIDKRIPAYFGRIPRITYGVETMPAALSANMPPAYAQPSPADRSAPGIFWASAIPAKCPSYMHVALAGHEAWPGHLMHIALMHEQDGLPDFRRHGAVKYTACVEGWALYCEGLAAEMGLYQTPHEHYGRLEMEMWRAVRLVVDTGIHWLGWSRDQAIAYMTERLALSAETIAGEVDRYAALPAQALAYQIGNLRIRALRARAEAALGDRFSHRGFHDAITGIGAVTLPVLDDLVGAWIDREAATPRAAAA